MAQATRSSVPIHISSLPTPLRLVSIPHRALVDYTHPLLRLLLSPPTKPDSPNPTADRFLNVTRNAVELSIFADEALVARSFPVALARADRAAVNGFADQDDNDEGEEEIECSRETWIALQVEQEASSDDDWESAGARVKELAHPLAANGISILFLSTYLSDYLLVKQPDLSRVFDRLGAVGFTFDAVPTDDDVLSPLTSEPFSPLADVPPSPFSTTRSASLSRSVTMNKIRSSSASASPSRAGPSTATGGPVSLSGSVVLSEKGSVGGGGGSSAPATPPRGPSVTMSRTTTQEIPPVVDHAPAGRTQAGSEAEGKADEDLFKAVEILPDELICVGLDRAYEPTWMTAILKALLFPSDVLGHSSPSSPDEAISRSDSLASGSSFSSDPYPSSSQPRPRRKGTRPKEFVSITQTAEEASLTADLSLLRALFPNANEEAVIFTVGNRGLNGRWRGETADDEEEEEEAGDDEGVEPGRTVRVCLQIDLSADSSFGLDRHGVVDMLSDRLLSASIPMLYTSTFKTANVLVPKSDLRRARRSLAT